MAETQISEENIMFHIEYPRSVPERKPPNHRPAAPRYTLRWPHSISNITSQYHGLQCHGLSREQQQEFFDRMESAFAEENGPSSFERMVFVDEEGELNAVAVSYWLDATSHAKWAHTSSISRWFEHPDRLTDVMGCWRETLTVPYDRHETIYSEPHYKIGLARTEQAKIISMTVNGYFGAARDRIPVSAIDALESPLADCTLQAREVDSRGKRLLAVVPHNMAALRSGQYWEAAEGEQLADYEENMEPKLSRGMQHLTEEKVASGTLAIRVMTNVDAEGEKLRETSTLAYFRSLVDMEQWAASHHTHLAIYRHAISMNRKFKQDRQVVTWHELFIMYSGSCFEYINCHPKTGLLPFAPVYSFTS